MSHEPCDHDGLRPACASARSLERSAAGELGPQVSLRGWPGLLLLLGCLMLVGLVGVLGAWAGATFSFYLLYLVPVAWGAWRGGFAAGVLVGLGSVAAWHGVDLVGGHPPHPAIGLLNGVIRFGVLVVAASLLARLRVSMLHEKALARTDPLTGAANGRTFYEEIGRAVQHGLRGGQPLTLAYLDLDHFKLLNDRQGHSVGDEALRHVARTIHHNIRAGDTLARLGGDEFALLLPETSGPEAVALLGRLHQLLTQEMHRRGWPVTISLGAATFLRPTVDIDVMVGRTDALMYAAKAKGKNRLEHQVVTDLAQQNAGSRHLERRVGAFTLCDRPARVQTQEAEEPREEIATVREISASGLGLHLERRLSNGTLVTVEPLYPCGARALLARVVLTTREGAGWSHQCALPARLGPEEVRLWVGAQAPPNPQLQQQVGA
jgi:diguanylate cyclase (GGDEF)-like protein